MTRVGLARLRQRTKQATLTTVAPYQVTLVSWQASSAAAVLNPPDPLARQCKQHQQRSGAPNTCKAKGRQSGRNGGGKEGGGGSDKGRDGEREGGSEGGTEESREGGISKWDQILFTPTARYHSHVHETPGQSQQHTEQ